MRRHLYFLAPVLISLVGLTSYASPALRTFRTARQSDGTTLTYRLAGDERRAYFATPDGAIVGKAADGDYCYGFFSSTGDVALTATLAHNEGMRTPAEADLVRLLGIDVSSFYSQPQREVRAIGSQATAAIHAMGAPTIPVILVAFSDKPFTLTADYMNRHFNEAGFNRLGAKGSVRDYFVSQSQGLFTPSFDIIGPVTLSHPVAYYGAHQGSKTDIRSDQMATDAIDRAVLAGANFSRYENKCVAIIYAGQGEHAGGDDNTIWAKFTSIPGKTAGSATITSYLCTNEMLQLPGRALEADGIGTFCHEFSHAMGLPDFYNTNGAEGIFGMDRWSIMDYGQYWESGYQPSGYTAYERSFMGWLTLETLHPVGQTVVLPPLGVAGQKAYKIPNPHDATGNEYYILENRQPVCPWFPAALGTGMLINRVDYHSDAWLLNTVNNTASHQRMTILPADGVLTQLSNLASSYQADPFPGLLGKTTLTSATVPADSAYKGGFMGIRLYHIRVQDGTVLFEYMEEAPAAIPLPLYLADEPVSVYAVDGTLVLRTRTRQLRAANLPAGVYIAKTGNQTYKFKIK